MKKLIVLSLILFMGLPVNAKQDEYSLEYLQSKRHFAVLNPLSEAVAQKAIKKSLKKQTNQDFRVRIDGYNLKTFKEGIFKNLEISGEDLVLEEINIPYLKLKSMSDYNWIDYKQKPIQIKSDMVYSYEIYLSEQSINQALDHKEYKKTLEKVNSTAYPLFVLKDVNIRVKNNKVYLIMEYNFPISPMKKNKIFTVSTGFKVLNNKIIANEVYIDKSYGNLQSSKVSNLINLLDPLSYTLSLLDDKKCYGKIENIKIIDNIVQINGKIYVKGNK